MRGTRSAIVIVALLCGIALVVALTWWVRPAPQQISSSDSAPAHSSDTAPSPTSSAVALEFEPFSLAAAEAARSAQLAGAPPVDPQSTEVRALLGSAELLGWVEQSSDGGMLLEVATTRFELAAAELVGRHGESGYGQVGELAWQRLLAALNEPRASRLPRASVTGVSGASAARLAAAASALAWQRTWRRAAWLGGFLAVAEQERLIGTDGRLRPEAEPLAHLLFRWMWAGRGQNVIERARVLTPDEVVALRRWQIEQSSLPESERLRLVEAVRPVIGALYDVDRAAAVILARSGRTEAARAALQRSLERARGRQDARAVNELEGMLQRLP